MIEIRKIDAAHKADANIPNQPFEIRGRLIPSLRNGKWEYQVKEYSETTEMCFPDFPYDPAEDDSIFLGAYDGTDCIGVAVLRKALFRYLYLDDLKVNREYRGKGVGALLIDACMEQARSAQMQGVYTIGQDNNLAACLFYLHRGFEIGGFDNRGYRGTVQEDKADIYFYKDC